LIRARPEERLLIKAEDFHVHKVGNPYQKPEKLEHWGVVLFWTDWEVGCDAVIPRAAFYDVVITIKGKREFAGVPRLVLIVDDIVISEIDFPIPKQLFVTDISTNLYLEKVNHNFEIRMVKKPRDAGVYVMKLELIHKDMVVVSKNTTLEGNNLTARYQIRNLALEPWCNFVRERDLGRTEHGLFITKETGLDVQGEYRPAIFAPPGTVFEWTVLLPEVPILQLGMATLPST